MGGAATVCIQYSDGSRDSYMAYNRGMSIIANHSSILNAKTDEERDNAARDLFKNENESYKGAYFEDHPGLAPNWYGLVFIDLKKKRVVDCNGYMKVIRYLDVDPGYANDYAENVLRLAELGYLLKSDLYPKSRNLNDMEKASVEDVELAIKNFRESRLSFWVSVPDWEYVNWKENYKELWEYLKQQGYNFSEQENDRWIKFLEERE